MSGIFLLHLSWFLLDLLPRIVEWILFLPISEIVFPLSIFQPCSGWQTLKSEFGLVWNKHFTFSKSCFQHPYFSFNLIGCSLVLMKCCIRFGFIFLFFLEQKTHIKNKKNHINQQKQNKNVALGLRPLTENFPDREKVIR